MNFLSSFFDFFRKKINIKDVFKPAGLPTYTYVERENGRYERILLEALDDKNKLCLITGVSKTGKTALYNNVLLKRKLIPLKISCNKNITVEEFWRIPLEDLKFERITQTTTGTSNSYSSDIKLRGDFTWSEIAKIIGQASLGITKTNSENLTKAKALSELSPKHLMPILKKTNLQLVIEDFHYLDKEVGIIIFQQCKEFIENNIPVIVIGTTHHAVDIAFLNSDLIARLCHITVEPWSNEDLAQIVIKGCNSMNLELDDEITDIIAEESVGLPIIVQETCLKLLQSKKILHKLKKKEKINVTKEEIYKIFHEIATYNFSLYESIFKRLSTGLRTSSKQKYHTYELILLIFSLDPIKSVISVEDMMERLDSLSDSFNIPPKSAIIKTLNNLEKLQEKHKIELLEWLGSEQSLYILKLTFLFYLRWRTERSEPPSFEYIIETLYIGTATQDGDSNEFKMLDDN